MAKCIEHLWIPMPDGSRLGARDWLPENTESKVHPGILEYIPYRKDDYTAIRDSMTIAWFAERGYACIRVDMRGSGSSDGVMFDEYSEQEIDDGVAVINWMAEQDWCDGNVATIGISWGGITGLQLAQRAPKPLKTVIALGASEFRYYDDGSYYIGCMVGQTIGWGTLMFGYNTRPPDPRIREENWRELWLERLQNTPHYLEYWLSHQREDDYWMRGTVGSNYEAIKIPVYAVSGHADCWPNTVPRLLENLSTPVRGLQGAWCHRYPHLGIPGPTINFLEDAARWFDQWLKGEDTGILEESPYQVYLQDSARPQAYYETRKGKWVGEPSWPSTNVDTVILNLDSAGANQSGLNNSQSESRLIDINTPQTVGSASGEYMPWFAFGPADELPNDQRGEDEASIVFDTEIYSEDIQILGNAEVELTIQCDKPQALIAVRLCDVWSDGASTLITRGILNISQRESKAEPSYMVPGQTYTVRIKLNHVGYTLAAGNRLRIALSTSYWPIAWPSPENATVNMATNLSKLYLPVRKASAELGNLSDFSGKTESTPIATTQIKKAERQRGIHIDQETGNHVYEISSDNGKVFFEGNQLEMASNEIQRYTIHPDKPTTAKAEYEWTWEYSRDKDWDTKTFTRSEISCDKEYFYLKAKAIAWENDEIIFEKHWDEKYPRDHF